MISGEVIFPLQMTFKVYWKWHHKNVILRLCVHAYSCIYTNKWLYSVIASLAPSNNDSKLLLGTIQRVLEGIEPLHTLIAIKIYTTADSSC